MKRTFVAACMFVMLVAGAGFAQNAGVTRIRYVMPGNASADNDAVLKLVNARLKGDAGLELECTFIPWDAWENKINLMLSTGEEFDLFHIMQDWIPFTSYHSKGGLADITAAVDAYGPNIKKVVPAAMWDGARLGGTTYVVPTFWLELASSTDLEIRTDLLKANKLPMPRTPDELLADAEIVMKNAKSAEKLYIPLTIQGNTADPPSLGSDALHRAYSTFPFVVKEKLFYVSQAGEVKSWVETDEFKKDAAWFRKAYLKGLVNPDVLAITQDQFTTIIQSGNWLVKFGTVGGGLATMQKNWPDLKDADIVGMKFFPEKPDVRVWGIKNCNGVPSTSRHPEAGVKFINWLYANSANYNLFMYGVEGQHYKAVGAKTITAKRDKTGNALYGQADWMIGNLSFIRVDSDTPTATIKELYTLNTRAINSPAADFFFNASAVRAELSAVMTEMASSMVPLYIGVLDWDKNYPAALEKMKRAGLDKVVADYKRQFAAHLSGR
jgi:putative aldouronate transport system substrate-binding protein